MRFDREQVGVIAFNESQFKFRNDHGIVNMQYQVIHVLVGSVDAVRQQQVVAPFNIVQVIEDQRVGIAEMIEMEHADVFAQLRQMPQQAFRVSTMVL